MIVSLQGYNNKTVTLKKDATVTVKSGEPLVLSDSNTVKSAASATEWIGVATAVSTDCVAVQMQGFCTVSISGTLPSVGYAWLEADGKGALKKSATDETGRKVLVVEVNSIAKTAGILL